MAVKCTPVVFITANVGSIFEEPTVMLKIWTREFLSTIARLDPKFVALHCQEVGGKNYEKSMQHVEHFVQLLVDSEELRLFDKVRVFLDEDYSSAENFTALGNLYFIHESITDALIFDFESKNFMDVSGKEIYSKNIELVPTKQKSKFPLQYFPECKWSRKGFLRTRWSLNGVVFDLVNIHLFHDASNFVAIKSFPSMYSDTRRRALAYTLERFQTDEFGSVPLFLFGDFNFRADTKGVVKHLSEGLNCSTTEGDTSTIEFRKEGEVVLTLGKKEFCHSDHQNLFSLKEGNWLREFDKELDAFSDQLFEFSISFPPSYPFEENSSGDKCYMKTRCPAWCDRVILSHTAIPLVRDTTGPGNVEYGLMGRNACMGDHKPVYLKVTFKGSTEKESCPDDIPGRLFSIQQTVSNALTQGNDTPCDKNGLDKNRGSKYLELGIEKLTCNLEALIAQSGRLNSEVEGSIEPDLSRCSTCKTQQHVGNVVDHAGGEQVSLSVEDEKILGLLAYEIKVPESALKKLGASDTGQKMLTSNCRASNVSRVEGENPDRFGTVKRVNSASLVENKPKKEDWKNSRCNSDVSWNPSNMVTGQSPDMTRIWEMNKLINRGNSRIRLISSSNSLNVSLPRLTSHHSSSDEEWFEEVEESDDDVLEVSCDQVSERRKITRRNQLAEAEEEPAAVNEAGDKAQPVGKLPCEVSSSDKSVDGRWPDLIGAARTNDEAKDSETYIKDIDTKSEPLVAKSETDGSATRSGISSDVFDTGTKSDKKTPTKTFSILRRLTSGRKNSSDPLPNGKSLENSGSFENLIVGPNVIDKQESALRCEELGDGHEGMKLSDKLITFSAETFVAEVKGKQFEKYDVITKDSVESWETIELGDKKLKEGEINDFFGEVKEKDSAKSKKCKQDDQTGCCCTIQ